MERVFNKYRFDLNYLQQVLQFASYVHSPRRLLIECFFKVTSKDVHSPPRLLMMYFLRWHQKMLVTTGGAWPWLTTVLISRFLFRTHKLFVFAHLSFCVFQWVSACIRDYTGLLSVFKYKYLRFLHLCIKSTYTAVFSLYLRLYVYNCIICVFPTVQSKEFTWRSNNVVVRGSHCMYEENQPSEPRNTFLVVVVVLFVVVITFVAVVVLVFGDLIWVTCAVFLHSGGQTLLCLWCKGTS